MAWPTAQTVVTQAALELGLIQSSSEWGDDVYQSSSSTVAQFLALLKKAGRDLVDEFDWSHLRQEYAFLTESAATAQANAHQILSARVLPADWKRMIAQTGWNRTSRLPMGSLSEQEWQYLSSRMTGVVLNVLFRPMQGLLFLYPSSSFPSGQEIVVAYQSSYWAVPATPGPNSWAPTTSYGVNAIVMKDAGTGGAGYPFVKFLYRCVAPGISGTVAPDPAYGTVPFVPKTSGVLVDGTCQWNWIGSIAVGGGYTSATAGFGNVSCGFTDVPTAGPDGVLFDEELVVAKLKLLWLKAKGFDSTDADAEYQRCIMQATSNDVSAPILSLNGQGIVKDRLLGPLNIPVTGFGS